VKSDLYFKLQSLFSYYNRQHHLLYKPHLNIRVHSSVSPKAVDPASLPSNEKVFIRRAFLNALHETRTSRNGDKDSRGKDYRYPIPLVDYCLQCCLLLFSNLSGGAHPGSLKSGGEGTISFQPQEEFLRNFLDPFIYLSREDEEKVFVNYEQTHYVSRSTVLYHINHLKVLMLKIILVFFFWSDITEHTPFVLLVSARDLFRYCHCKVSTKNASSVVKEKSFGFVDELKELFLSQDGDKERKIHKQPEVPYGVLLENIRYLMDNLFLFIESENCVSEILLKT
jgi:hypothetical protein